MDKRSSGPPVNWVKLGKFFFHKIRRIFHQDNTEEKHNIHNTSFLLLVVRDSFSTNIIIVKYGGRLKHQEIWHSTQRLYEYQK